jgi:uncharacterized protein YidB (DUF937 family)
LAGSADSRDRVLLHQTLTPEDLMGLLDQLAGQVMGSLGGQNQDPVPQGKLLGGVLSMIDRFGGLPALLQRLNDSGLNDQLASWIGTGENQPVSGDQIKDALGEDQVQQIAQQAGMDAGHASTGLAQLLPQIIDKLTPDGNVPRDDIWGQGLSLLKSQFFGTSDQGTKL